MLLVKVTTDMEVERGKLADLAAELATREARLQVFKLTLQDASGGVAKKIGEKVTEEETQIAHIIKQIRESEAKISAYEDLRKILPKEQVKLREGSDLSKIEQLIRTEGGYASLDEIVKHIGDDGDAAKKKKSIRGTLRAYSRDGKVFDFGPDPDSFTLIEFNSKNKVM